MSDLITSTRQLTPAGVLGYAKGIAAAVSAVLVSVASFLPDEWQGWVQGAVAVCGAVAVLRVPNAVEPVVVQPVVNPQLGELSWGEPGKHEAQD